MKDRRNRKAYHKSRRSERIRLGLCTDCVNPARPKSRTCTDCGERLSKHSVQERKRLKERGLCISGDGNPVVPGNVSCGKCLLKNTENARRAYAELRNRVIAGYGGRCICCGESIEVFLTLDHVLNNGADARKQSGYNLRTLYKRVIDDNFPPEYQLHCWNCNCGRAKNGGICPHKGLRCTQI